MLSLVLSLTCPFAGGGVYMEEAPFHSATPKNIRYMTHLITYIIVLIILYYIMRYHQVEIYIVFTFSLITQKVVEQFSKS